MTIRAFILVTAKPGTSREIVSSRKIRGVKLSNSVFGRFDAVIVVEAKDTEELGQIVYELVGHLPDVIHTETLVSIPDDSSS